MTEEPKVGDIPGAVPPLEDAVAAKELLELKAKLAALEGKKTFMGGGDSSSATGIKPTNGLSKKDAEKLKDFFSDLDEEDDEEDDKRQPDRPSMNKRKVKHNVSDQKRFKEAKKEFDRGLEDLIETVQEKHDCSVVPWVAIVDEKSGTFRTNFKIELNNARGK